MTFAELTETKGWKNFMAKLYGIGASVVIVGALFKIQHWPMAGLLLIIGLTTEAVIFFFSAFEPLHEEDDWSLVFPQLAGLEPNEPVIGAGGGGTSVSLFDAKILEQSDNPEQLVAKLAKGLDSLASTSAGLTDISNATLATSEYADSMKSASKTVNEFSSSYQKSADDVNASASTLAESYVQSAETIKSTVDKTAESISYSVDGLSDSLSKVGQNISDAGSNLAASYNQLTESMKVEVDFSAVIKGNESYNDKLGVLNKNLSALNAVFELQLEGGLDQMMDDLKGAVEESQKYKTQVSQLADRVEALNSVYGNMLSAMKLNS
jgi:gliding motility-associated protein GldL